MRVSEYHVAYTRGERQEFTRKFEPIHFDEAKVSGFPGISSLDLGAGMPQIAALSLVNKWNRQNAVSGFVYWID